MQQNMPPTDGVRAFLSQSEIKAVYGDLFIADPAFEDCDGIEEIVCAHDENVIVRRVFATEPDSVCFMLHDPQTQSHQYYMGRFKLVPGRKVVLKQKWVCDRWVDFT